MSGSKRHVVRTKLLDISRYLCDFNNGVCNCSEILGTDLNHLPWFEGLNFGGEQEAHVSISRLHWVGGPMDRAFSPQIFGGGRNLGRWPRLV